MKFLEEFQNPWAGTGLGAGKGVRSSGLGAMQALQPFLQKNSGQVLQRAAAMGEMELNRSLHQLSMPGTQRVELLEDGPPFRQRVDRMTPRGLGMRQDLPIHEAVPMLVELKEEIRRKPRL